MVGVSMRKRHYVEFVKPPGPQVGRYYVFADIQFRMHPERYTSGIHEERAALRRNQKDRIALAHVNSSEFEYSVPQLRMRRNSADPQSADGQRRPSGGHEQPAAATQNHRQHQRSNAQQNDRALRRGYASVGDPQSAQPMH